MLRQQFLIAGIVLLAGMTWAAAGARGDAAYRRAVTYYKTGEYPAAITALQAAVADNPKFAPARGLLGYLYLRTGRAEDAVSQLQNTVALAPKDAAARNNLGSAFLELGRSESAIRQFRVVLAMNPMDAAARSNLATAWLDAGNHDQQAHAPRARYDFTQAIGLGTSLTGPAHFALGKMDARAGRESDAAADFADAAHAAPQDFAAWYDLGVSQEQAGRSHAAVQAYNKALRLRPNDPNGNLALGLLLAAANDPAALAPLTRVITARPDAAPARAARAPLLDAQGQWVPARADWEAALQLAPTDAATRQAFAEALMAHKQYADAAAQYKILVQRSPRSAPLQISCGLADEAAGNLAAAQAAFREALTLNPKDAQAENDLGVTYETQGQEAQARDAYRKAAALDPSLPEPRKNLARFASR